MAEVKWIKLTTDMFDNRKIKHLRRLPEGNNIVLMWVMLLTLAGRCNSGGMIFLTENIPYTVKMLADEFGFEESTVQIALAALINFGMIVDMDGCYAVKNWEEYQNIDGLERIREQTRKRVAEHRKRKRIEQSQCNATCNDDVTQGNAIDIDKDIDIEVDKDIEIDKEYSIPKSLDSIQREENKEKGKTKVFPKKKAFPESAVLDETFAEYKRMRVAMKKPMTDRAVTLATNNIRKLATDVNGNFDEGLAVKIIEQSIQYNWLGFFELKDGAISHSGQSRSDRIKNRIAEVDNWHI